MQPSESLLPHEKLMYMRTKTIPKIWHSFSALKGPKKTKRPRNSQKYEINCFRDRRKSKEEGSDTRERATQRDTCLRSEQQKTKKTRRLGETRKSASLRLIPKLE